MESISGAGVEMTASPESHKVEALAGYLKDCLQAERLTVESFSRLSGGAIQDNFGITVVCRGGPNEGRHALAVRSDAPSKVAVSMSRAQEFRVLQVAHEAGVTVPRPFWCCEDASVIGAPFCVMARVNGSASPRELVRQMGANPAQARELVMQLGSELARIHSVVPDSPAAQRLHFLPMPSDKPALARVAEYRAALDAIPLPQPVLEWALNWLAQHAVDSGLRTLCHGDFRTGNYMVEDGRVTAVLDWEFASWGDPYEDLGWLCARSWRFGAAERAAGGIGDRHDLYAAWEAGTGHAVDDRQVRYWEVMGMVRWAVIALQQGQRHLSGEQPSLELALTGRMLPEIELDILATVAQFEGQPISAVALQPWHAPQGEASHAGAGLLAPDARNTLQIARQTLLGTLLSQLPESCTYEALMVANAMAAAQRELADGGRSHAGVKQAVRAFLQGAQMWQDSHSASDPRAVLARSLRAGRVPPTQDGALRSLLILDTCTRLALTNPKYLAGHQESARALSTTESGE